MVIKVPREHGPRLYYDKQTFQHGIRFDTREEAEAYLNVRNRHARERDAIFDSLLILDKKLANIPD